MKAMPWTFLTLHGHSLVYLTSHPNATCREIAQAAGVTERAIQKVIHDFVEEGYIVRKKTGRGNTYTIHPELPMRHGMEREHAVGDLLKALGNLQNDLGNRSGDSR